MRQKAGLWSCRRRARGQPLRLQETGRQDSFDLNFAAAELKWDHDMLEAVRQGGGALQFAAAKLKADRQFAAVGSCRSRDGWRRVDWPPRAR